MNKPSWKYRRRVVFGTLIFCALAITWLVVRGEDIRLHETIAIGLIGLAVSVIGSYVFGAAWDDRNVMLHGGAPKEPASRAGGMPPPSDTGPVG